MDHSNLLKNFGSIMVAKARHEYPLSQIEYMEEVTNRGIVYQANQNYIRFAFALVAKHAPDILLASMALDGIHHSWELFSLGELPVLPDNDPNEEEPLGAA